jgi:CelD/BcsL family acetyltransferase involved in cellulose biosynthesis
MAGDHYDGDTRMETDVIDDLGALQPYASDWDALAVANGRPFCAPGWVLAWWRHVAAPAAQLRVVVVRRAGRLIGIAPWLLTASPHGLRIMRPVGAGTSQRIEPLAEPGLEPLVAMHLARALAGSRCKPDVVCLDGVDKRSPWPALLSSSWPGGTARRFSRYEHPAPTVDLRDRSFESWYAGRSRNFRRSFRKRRRRFERQGGTVRLANLDTLGRDVAALARVHSERWAHRGGSSVLVPGMEHMLLEAGCELLPLNRFRLWVLEIDGEVASASLALAAGSEYGSWLGGFDRRHAELSPALLNLLVELEDAFACGAERMDLGGGLDRYKLRFADGQDTLGWFRLLTPGPRSPLAWMAVAPGLLRRVAAERIPDELGSVVRDLERQLRRQRRTRSGG